MPSMEDDLLSICTDIIEQGVAPILSINSGVAYITDPVFGIDRNRANAEVLKALIRLHMLGVDPVEGDGVRKLMNWILGQQNEDGSWNEIHSYYNQPSALITSLVGESLFLAMEIYHDYEQLGDCLEKAKQYVLASELSPGYFLKSAQNYADHLNVNASCGAFLAELGQRDRDRKCLDAARRAARRVCSFQFNDGAYPYTTVEKAYSSQSSYVPCIHYQGVTMFYLSRIHRVLGDERVIDSLLHGAKWLASVQSEDGHFDWSKSGLMYAYFLSGSHAFAASAFCYLSQYDNNYFENAYRALYPLKKNINGLVNRWEAASLWSLPLSISQTLKTANLGNCTTRHRLFKLGYGLYKQVARRRYSVNLDDALFRRLSKLMGIKSTWIEPIRNYPDLFMTSEVLDCLTYSLLWLNQQKGSDPIKLAEANEIHDEGIRRN
ncbi:MAG: prenyltransferase/squalene oxidase repeat-containing protein [Chloroflexota bacterium]